MKIKSYRTLYRFFSFLSDKTNGASFFVKYKLALGALLIGLTTVSCSNDEEEEMPIMCYDMPSVTNETQTDITNQKVDEVTIPFDERSENS